MAESDICVESLFAVQQGTGDYRHGSLLDLRLLHSKQGIPTCMHAFVDACTWSHSQASPNPWPGNESVTHD